MKRDFVFIDEMMPGIRWDAKYATWDNFTGRPVDGYEVNRVVGTRALVAALLEAQGRAAARGLGLLLWDGYRPQRAVDCFVRWAAQPEDGVTKQRHYPGIRREEMITRGYVAAKSGHSRGSAIDLTLFRLDTNALLPMGTGFDFMDERSHHGAAGVSGEVECNRALLCAIMEESGFKPFDAEWWHYSLREEPYPDRYFDIPIDGTLSRAPAARRFRQALGVLPTSCLNVREK